MPKSSSAQGACSRVEPQPKLSSGHQDLRVAVGRLVEHEIRLLAAVVLVALFGEQPLPRPVRLMVLRYCLGMIMSVSTLMIRSGAATPFDGGEFVHGPLHSLGQLRFA